MSSPTTISGARPAPSPRPARSALQRSHYEDVLVAKVRELPSAHEIERRYDQLNAFEKHLSENRRRILKFMLQISREEQRERLQDRLDDRGGGGSSTRRIWRIVNGGLRQA